MHLSHRLLRVSLAALLPAAGLVIGFGSTASASTHTASHQLSKAALVREITKELNNERHATMQGARVLPRDKVASSNWSGYADTGSGFTKVIGSWTEPTVTCTSATSFAVFWVGIDGYSSGTVEQDGTGVQCSGGVATPFTWWELFPTNSIQVVSTALRAGDKITASVVRSGTKYTMVVADHTHTAASFTKTATCAAATCLDTSAEWIAEAPSNSSGVLPLSQFSKWTLVGASVSTASKTGTISSFTNHEITMENGSKQVKAQPGGLFNSGKDFSVTWKRST